MPYTQAMQEPPLREVMSDPIIRLLMQHDQVCETDIASLAERLAEDAECASL